MPGAENLTSDAPDCSGRDLNVAIGRWGIAAAPSRLCTLLGSCIGIALHDRIVKVGGLAHVVLPRSRGVTDSPGKFADTAIPALIADLDRALRGRSRGRLTAKIFGGACMFQVEGGTSSSANIGEQNRVAVEQALLELRIPILARDIGGNSGRRLTFNLATGVVLVRVPGGDEYEI